MARLKIKAKKRKKANLLIILILLGLFGYLTYYLINNNSSLKKYLKLETSDSNNVMKEEKAKLKIVDVDSKSRPIAVMINNINVARPYQSGLQKAYLTYEIIAEGGISRILALFKDQEIEKIGTVRSSRHYYLDYVLENDAIYVHWGFSPQAESDIKTYKINNINGLKYSNKYFWKDTSLKVASEHTAYTSTSLIAKAISDLNYRTDTDKDLLLNYSVDEITLNEKTDALIATNVDITYSNSNKINYEYNSDDKYYYRSVNGVKHTDYVTGEQYHYKNIIVYQIENVTIANDDKGRQDLKNIGTGTGYYITNGYAIPIKWEKNSRNSQTKYRDMENKEIVLNDGNTFIQIQPKGQSLNIS